MSALHAKTATNSDPVSITRFAYDTGLSVKTIERYCRQGRIFGARKHPLTKKWWIYPPAKLLCQPRSYQRKEGTSTQMTSTSQGVEQV